MHDLIGEAVAAQAGSQALLEQESVTPSVTLLQELLALKGGLPPDRLARLRRLVDQVVRELLRELTARWRPALAGTAVPRPTRRPAARWTCAGRWRAAWASPGSARTSYPTLQGGNDRSRIGNDVRLEGLRWLGITTDRPEAMVGFLRDVLGLHIEFEEPTMAELSLPAGDRVQVFAPGNVYHDRYRSQGIVPLFELNDVRTARRELQEAGFEVGELDSDATWEWVDVRAPDGRLYILASRLERRSS
jgi:hypothetical protein